MSTKNMDKITQNSYFRNNRIRTKLLLFIDNEIQNKIKQNHQNLKFNCGDENKIMISFEETFSQKQTNKYIFNTSDKSVSTVDDSSNKLKEKLEQKKRVYSHSKTLYKEDNLQNKILDDNICFHKKIYSIKNISRQSSTFLILPKHKYAAEYLKTLCNNLKKHKSFKKPTKHCESINIKSKLFNFSKEKKTPIKYNKIKIPKSQKNNLDKLYKCSLFRKPQKENFVINSKLRNYGKSSNSILIKFNTKE